jgi:hypothetical protein
LDEKILTKENLTKNVDESDTSIQRTSQSQPIDRILKEQPKEGDALDGLSRQNLFLEVWEDIREDFKILIKDTIIFALLLFVLALSHLGLGIVDYPETRKSIIDWVHFIAYLIVIIIFLFGFICEVGVLRYLRISKRLPPHSKED